jgi:hypothetical protein
MHYSRIALAGVVAWVVDSLYGYLVYARLLAADFGANTGAFRAAADQNLPLIFVGTLIGMLTLAFVYAKGYEGGPGIPEGLRFGAVIGVFMTGYVSLGNYATLNITGDLAVKFGVAAFIEMIVVGAALGAVYKAGVGGSTGR